MEVQFGANVLDEPSLQYKLQGKVKTFAPQVLPNRGYNLIACSSIHGIVFIGSPEWNLRVYYLKDLIDKECETPKYMCIKLAEEKPTHIAINSTEEFLLVTGGTYLSIYRIVDFQNPTVSPAMSLKCGVSANTFISSLQWNPAIPDTIAVVFFDGTLLVAQINTGLIKKIASKASCICWSPKGKQLVVGNSDGSLCQYKPDLSPMKTIPAPNLFEGSPVEAIAIHWISTYQFAVVYRNAVDQSRPCVTIVNTPKAGQLVCLNYEDICYSIGSSRPWYYYLTGIAQWNLILASSSNSMEIATLASKDGASWIQWCQSDEARPELPMTYKSQENYPVGLAIATSALHQLPWGENETLPFMPMLLVLSHLGYLSIYNIINLDKAAPNICSPIQQFVLPASALISDTPAEATVQAPPAQTAPIINPKSEPTIQTQQPSQISQVAPIVASFQPNITVPTVPSISTQLQPKTEVKLPQSQCPVHVPIATSTPPQSASKIQAMQDTKANEMKLDQERAAALKANQELKNMLIKEVNEFQMDMYKFKKRVREVHGQFSNDIGELNSTASLQDMNAEKLKQDCSVDELRASVSYLKLELVRTCAVIAEARTHSEAKELQHFAKPDPLSKNRLSSIQSYTYYIQNQLDQAYKALDYKWREIPGVPLKITGPRMLRPILDDVYQPLVKQQEILGRQQAVLRTLRKTLAECDPITNWKSTSLLRSTPFKKADPLSKLTKNILNMSIEPKESPKTQGLTGQKLDALRDMLANHKTVKIKPVNIELHQHLAAMKLKYEKSLKEKANQEIASRQEHAYPVHIAVSPQVVENIQPISNISQEKKPQSIPSYKHTGMSNVARNLFTDGHKTAQPQVTTPSFINDSASNSRSVLKDLLQNKPSLEVKNDANTFMGQAICSPTPKPAPSEPIFAFGTKPSNVSIFGQPSKENESTFNPTIETRKPQITPKSAETGEFEDSLKNFAKTSEKDQNVFVGLNLKTEPQSSIVPDVLKTAPVWTFGTGDLSQSISKSVTITAAADKQKKAPVSKPSITLEITPKTTSQPTSTVSITTITKTATNAEVAKSTTSSAASIFAIANAASGPTSPSLYSNDVHEPVFSSGFSFSTTPTRPSDAPIFGSPTSSSPDIPTSPVFAKAQSPTVPNTAASIFSAKATSIFGSKESSPKLEADTKTSEPTVSSAAAPTVFTASPTTAKSELATPIATSASTCTVKTPTTSSPTESTTEIFSTTEVSTSATPFSQASAFSSSAVVTTSIFAATTADTPSSAPIPSVFTPTTTNSQPSIFSSQVTTNQSSFFGKSSPVQTEFSASPATTTATSVFSVATTTQSSIFGAPSTPPATTQTSVFGTPTTTQTSVFGTPPTTQGSVFGTPTSQQASVFSTPTSTQASIFGVSSSAQPSLFGTPTTTQASVFGTPTSTQTSIFSTTTQASVFGSPPAQTSVFGTPTATSPTSVFGTPTPSSQNSLFGTPTQTTQASIFGTSPATSSVFGDNTSPFGTAESNLFSAATISPASAPQNNTGSIFGASSSGAAFSGGNANVFGAKPSFGQSNSTAASIFGSTAQQQPSIFWGGAANSSSFGSPAFGQTTQASSIFGGGGSFSSNTTPNQAFGSPTPAPSGSVFGSPQQSGGSGFGGAAMFGSKPAFGQSAGFGGSPGGFGSFGNKSPGSGGFGAPAAFGQSASFGSSSPGSGGMFGNSSPGFAQTTQSNATFETLATQNTLSFGNLAQQSSQQPQSNFNTSPSFTGWRS